MHALTILQDLVGLRVAGAAAAAWLDTGTSTSAVPGTTGSYVIKQEVVT